MIDFDRLGAWMDETGLPGGIAIPSDLSASATNAPQNLMVQQLSALPVQ